MLIGSNPIWGHSNGPFPSSPPFERESKGKMFALRIRSTFNINENWYEWQGLCAQTHETHLELGFELQNGFYLRVS